MRDRFHLLQEFSIVFIRFRAPGHVHGRQDFVFVCVEKTIIRYELVECFFVNSQHFSK